MDIDPDRFRRVMGRFPTGVAVLATMDDGLPRGITVNSLTSVSLDPPLVLVALAHRRALTPIVRRAGRFAVSVLADDAAEVAACFAASPTPGTPDRDAFCGVAWRPGASGMPVLEGAVATVECKVDRAVSVGDHAVFIGRVLALDEADPGRGPLVFHRRRFGRLAAPVEAEAT